MLLVDAYHVLGPCLEKDLTDKLGVASQDHDKLQITICLENNLLKVISADQLGIAVICLKQKEVALALVLQVKLVAKFLGVPDPMA